MTLLIPINSYNNTNKCNEQFLSLEKKHCEHTLLFVILLQTGLHFIVLNYFEAQLIQL